MPGIKHGGPNAGHGQWSPGEAGRIAGQPFHLQRSINVEVTDGLRIELSSVGRHIEDKVQL